MIFDGMELLCDDINTEEIIKYKKRKTVFLENF